MSNTYNRRPYYVDIPSDTTGFFVQSRFNGIKTNQNDVEIDQMSFIDAENVYVDEGGALVSRPPFKFSEGETNIVEQWNFGAYTLRLYRLYSFSTTVKGFWNIGTTYTKDDLVVKPGTNDLYMYINDTSTSGHDLTNVTYWTRYISQQIYVLRCISHESNEYAWSFPETVFGTDRIPKIKCVAIEDKIFIWFAGVDFIVFDLSTLTFEKATKYIYLPICKTVINGIENDLEAANFLTSAYRKRYLYSAISSINFDKLVDKRMSVYLNGPMTQNTSGYLYDITVGTNQKNLLVYPYSDVGNYHIETVQTDVALVTLRYDIVTKLIEISFDGMYFRSVPRLEDIVGAPQLSRDGMWLFAFTRTGLAKCRLVAQETLDFANPERVFSWTREDYCELDAPPSSLVVSSKTQVGYFETGDCYSYVINLTDTDNLFYTQFWAKDALDNSVLIGRKEVLNLSVTIPAGQIYFQGIVYDVLSEDTQHTLSSGDSTCVMHHQYIMRDTDVDPGVLAVLYADTFGVVWIRTTYSADSDTVTLDKGVITYNADDSSCLDHTVIRPDIYVEYPTSGRATCRLATGTAMYRGNVFFYGSYRVRSFSVGDFITTGTRRYRCIKDVPLEIPVENTEFVVKDSLSKGFYDGSKSYNYWEYVVDQTTGIEYRYINGTSVVANTIVGELTNADYWARKYGIQKEIYSTTKRYIDFGQEVIDDDGYTYSIIKRSSFHYTNTEYWEEVVGSTDVALTVVDDVFIEMIVGDTDIHDVSEVVFQTDEYSKYFKISRDSFVTENYLYMNGTTLILPVVGAEYVRPLSITDRGATYLIDGTIWTTTLDTMQSNTLELDEYMNCIIDGDDCELEACENVPDHAVTLDYHYFSYDNKLEATTIKRDSDHNIMLYLPNLNENVFTNRITNLHQLSETTLGVFTEKEIWYVSNPSMAPVKSKIPLGCREGNEIITALDGQALLFATPRGLTALAPQDFVATTEPSLKYLNDSIQVKYNPFYNGLVNNAFIAPDGYLPCVKITSYKYWILFYKYMSNEIYVLDTRDGSWWIWTTPYPIKSLYSDSRLHALFEVNYNQNVFNSVRTSMYAVPFIFADHELSSIGYYDDVVKNTISGVTEMITEGDVQRRVSYYASPDIDWHFLSQKLHFDKLNHYKAVKGININVAGDEVITAKMSTRAYRDFYHPESSIVVEIPINDLRTFSQRLNLLHLVNFQYKIENDTNEDTRGHLRLNSLSIKYERKEKIR
jgi:hypothetical protein